MLIKLVSWNVNGLRALAAKSDWRWFAETDAQIVALQETKAHPEQLKPEVASRGLAGVLGLKPCQKRLFGRGGVQQALPPDSAGGAA